MSESFFIVSEEDKPKRYNELIIYGLISLIILVLIFILIEIATIKKTSKQIIDERVLLKRGMIKRK